MLDRMTDMLKKEADRLQVTEPIQDEETASLIEGQ